MKGIDKDLSMAKSSSKKIRYVPTNFPLHYIEWTSIARRYALKKPVKLSKIENHRQPVLSLSNGFVVILLIYYRAFFFHPG